MANLPEWNASCYLKFADDRTRAARDLLAQVPLSSPARIVDLGCGPGNSTALLAQRYPKSEISGMDLSLNMLRSARESLPNLKFELADIQSYLPGESVDLFFSNAALQWLPGQERIPAIKRLLETQPSGSCFAVQVPCAVVDPFYTAIFDTVMDKRWEHILESSHPLFEPFPTSHEIYNAFAPLCSKVDIWQTSYEHRLDGHQAIVDWNKGAALLPFLEPLKPEQQAEFVAQYLERITKACPLLDDYGVLFRLSRLFIVLTKI